MTKEELYNNIEAFLNGELEGEALAAFKTQQERDSEFAAEVALHRSMQRAFEDPKKTDLKGLLDEIGADFDDFDSDMTDEKPPKTGGNSALWFLPIGLIALAGLGYWLFNRADVPDTRTSQNVPPVTEEVTTPIEETESVEVVEPFVEETDTEETEGASTPQVTETQEVETNILPATNPALERLLGTFGEEAEYEFQIAQSPSSYRLNNQLIPFQLAGEMLTSELPEDARFMLQIYSTSVDKFTQRTPELELPLDIRSQEEEEEDEPQFAFGEKEEFLFGLGFPQVDIPLETGTYYYVITLAATGEIWYVGKFSVQ